MKPTSLLSFNNLILSLLSLIKRLLIHQKHWTMKTQFKVRILMSKLLNWRHSLQIKKKNLWILENKIEELETNLCGGSITEDRPRKTISTNLLLNIHLCQPNPHYHLITTLCFLSIRSQPRNNTILIWFHLYKVLLFWVMKVEVSAAGWLFRTTKNKIKLKINKYLNKWRQDSNHNRMRLMRTPLSIITKQKMIT